MNRKELVRRVALVLRDNNVRKPIHMQKQVLHISDDDGNKKDFVVKKRDASVLYTADDIEAVIDACMAVIKSALKQGESILIRGFGILGLNYRKARTARHPTTGEKVDVEGRYVPKFTPGNDLRMCAKVYELSVDEKVHELPPIDYSDESGGE